MSRRSWAVVCLCLGLSLAAAGCGGSSVNGSIVDGSGDGTVNPGGDNVTTPAGDTAITPPAPVAEICNDGVDNDGNGVADCTDLACSSNPVCAPAPSVVEDCSTPGDEDGNGLADCADVACSGTSACLPPAVIAEDCGTVGDEDGNGQADCADSVCSGTAACGGPVVQIDPNRFKYKADWTVEVGPGPVCYDCPDPIQQWQYYGIDPAMKAEMVKEFGYRYDASAFKFTDGNSTPEAVKADAARQGF